MLRCILEAIIAVSVAIAVPVVSAVSAVSVVAVSVVVAVSDVANEVLWPCLMWNFCASSLMLASVSRSEVEQQAHHIVDSQTPFPKQRGQTAKNSSSIMAMAARTAAPV